MIRNQYHLGILTAIVSGFAFLLITFLISGKLDILSSLIFTITFGISYIIFHKVFGKK